MSLSPLWATQVNDLHVSMTFGPPSVFRPTLTKSPKDRHLSGPKSGAPPPQPAVAKQEGGGAPHTGLPPVAFAARSGFHTQTLAPYLDSLVRVSRRAISVRGLQGCRGRRAWPSLAGHAGWIPNNAPVTLHVRPYHHINLSRGHPPHPESLKQSAVSRSCHLRFRILVNFPSQYLSAIDLHEVFRFSSAAPAVNPLLSK